MFSALLGFALLVSVIVPLHAQSQSYGCNSSWALKENTGMYGGAVQPSVTTETGCRIACYNNNSCIGVDWNNNSAGGNQCFLLLSPSSTYSGSRINHWDYNRTAPCAGVCGSWSLRPGLGTYGGTQTNASNEDDCKDKCKNQNGCIAVNWNTGTRLCYLLYSVGQTYSGANVNQWDFNSTAGCISPCGTWNYTDSSGQYGGTVWPSITSSDDCKSACENNSTCTGVDWNLNNPSGQQCFLLFGSGTRYTGNGVTHWEFIRAGNCSAPCAAWTYWNNTGQYGGTVYSSATNQEDCKRACTGTCTGVDWNSNNPSGQQCYLLFGSGTRYAGNNITHWEYNRNGSCPGGSTFGPSTFVPTQGVSQFSSAVTPIQSCFLVSIDMNIFGGSQISASSVTDCQNACRAMSFSVCQSIDWDRNQARCYILNKQTGKNSSPGVDHYDRRSDC